MRRFRSNKKSGQAIIFLIMVLFIGVFIVIWNFDLNRIIGAKFKMRNMGDSAALSAARWQGYSLNMIGEMNLIQVAIMTELMAETLGDSEPPEIPAEVKELMELRTRLELVGPLTSFVAAQQAAFNNGAFHDPDFSEELKYIAGDLENFEELGLIEPYPDAYIELADLMRSLSDSVAAASYSLELSGHVLEQEGFYSAIAQALRGSWCSMKSYRHWLSAYVNPSSWSYTEDYRGDSDFFKLKVHAFSAFHEDSNGQPMFWRPSSSLLSTNDIRPELSGYLETNETVEAFGDTDFVNWGIYNNVTNVTWHCYDSNWRRTWPKASISGSAGPGEFPFYADVKPEFNYRGAESAITMESYIETGIISRKDDDSVDLSYKTKAKAFGHLDVEEPNEVALRARFPENRVTPNYFGFVLPAFRDVRLVHSDIGDPVMSGPFYRHVKYHLPSYISHGLDGLDGGCGYCSLLEAWETLDREEGLEWIEWTETLPNSQDPCYVPPGGPSGGGGGGGGASGGS